MTTTIDQAATAAVAADATWKTICALEDIPVLGARVVSSNAGDIAVFCNAEDEVFALRDQFQKVRAFTFIDHVHEVTHHFTPGADVVDVMSDLAASTAHAALWGRTNYGRAFTKFTEEHAEALGPKASLLILGDARSNYSDLALDKLQDVLASNL